MPIFTKTGSHKTDYWLVNEETDWAVIPAGTIRVSGYDSFQQDLPIRLNVGDRSWGEKHISYKHSGWLAKNNKTAMEMLDYKLGQTGAIYTTEEDHKLKITLTLSPEALLVLRLKKDREGNDYLSVVTLYFRQGRIDGSKVGRYLSSMKTANHQKD